MELKKSKVDQQVVAYVFSILFYGMDSHWNNMQEDWVFRNMDLPKNAEEGDE